MKPLLGYLKSVAKYLGVVVGGITLFLILAPVVGYLPYSDRPGPGWHGSFPALSLREFVSNTGAMLEYGLFLAMLFVIPGAAAVLVLRGIERLVRRHAWRRTWGACVGALFAGYWMMGAGWYIAAGLPLLVLAIILGGVAGAWFLTRPVEFRGQGA
jgi:hypothetical protein